MIRAERNEKQELEALKTNMKKPMSAEEWSKENNYGYLQGVFIEPYIIYLLKHHLEQFAEEINNEFHKSGTISSILTDYLTKNNIK